MSYIKHIDISTMTLQQTYERQLIARIINNKSDYYENADIISADMFQVYADIYDSFAGLVKQGRYPTITKMLSLLPEKEAEFKEMIRSIDYDVPISELVSELDEYRKLRVINNGLMSVALKSNSDDKARELTNTVTSLYQTTATQFQTGYEAAKTALKNLEQKKKHIEIPTGFPYLDSLMGGLQRSDLVIIAAETSQGKTALALNISQNVLDAHRAVAVISLEMSEDQLMYRMIASKSGIPQNEFINNLPDITNTAASYVGLKLHIADVTNNNTAHILGLIRTAYIRFNVDVVVIDYLQLISDKAQKSREQEIGQTARSLKNIAKELNINIVALSQLSRPTKGYNHYPTMSRLRDSGQIEEAADAVIFIYRPSEFGDDEFSDGESCEGRAEIIMAKGRNYGTGKFRTDFQREITKFGDAKHRIRHDDNTIFAGVQEKEAPF
jgi:replicative DNA helicase